MSRKQILGGLIALGSALLFAGCNAEKSKDKVKEYTDIQSQIESGNQVAAERQFLEARAKTMETDLERRQRFYQAISGTFEGSIQVNDNEYNIRLTLTPSLPRYVPTGRVRTVEEVASDLTNLYLNVQVVQWNPQTNFGSVGCLITNVRPDIVKGRINVVSENCPNLYSFVIVDDSVGIGRLNETGASTLASAIAESRVDAVSHLSGRMQPTSNASVYSFSAVRVQE